MDSGHDAFDKRAELMVTSPILVLTIDSMPLVHAGVRQLLHAFPDIKLLGEAYATSEVPRLLAGSTPTVILIEIDDLGPGWVNTVQQLAAQPAARVIVFTSYASPERVQQALMAGVQGYLLKRIHALTLAQALRSVAVGQQVFAPEATQAMLVAQPEEDLLKETLSQREREVLALLANGLSNQAISARLCVSVATVKFHCRNVFSKLGVTTRAQAIAAAFAQNLVPRLVSIGDQTHLAAPGAHCEPLLRRA